MKTRHLSLVTPKPLDTVRERESVCSPYGPVKAGLTTRQITQDQQLSELLNSLESVVESLNFKSFTVYDILNTVMESLRVALLTIATDEGGTK